MHSAAESRHGGLFCFCFLFFYDFSGTNYFKIYLTDFRQISELVEIWLHMNNLTLVFRSLKGRRHGNRFLLLLFTEVIFVRQWLLAQPGGLKLGFALRLVFSFLPLFCLRFPAVDYTGAICQVLVHGVHFVLYRSIKAVIRYIYTTDACFVP